MFYQFCNTICSRVVNSDTPCEGRTQLAKPYYQVSSLAKGVRLLEVLAEIGPISLSQLAKRQGQHRSAIHRMLSTWRDLGYVVKDRHGQYRVSLRLFGMAQRVVSRLEILGEARTHMRGLVETHGETVHLGCLEDDELVVVDIVTGTMPLRYDLPVGTRGPAHASALGKAILAHASVETQKGYLSREYLTARTAATCTDPAKLVPELENIRVQGFATDVEEWAIGIKSLAAPVWDYHPAPFYALCVSGPVQRMTQSRLGDISRDLVAVTRRLSQSMGAG